MPAVLDELAARGFALAVVSNWDERLPRLLERLDLARRFAAIAVSQQVGVEKPHAAIFLSALERLGVEPAEAVHVGDRKLEDVEGARAAGLEALWLAKDGAGDLTSLAELPEKSPRSRRLSGCAAPRALTPRFWPSPRRSSRSRRAAGRARPRAARSRSRRSTSATNPTRRRTSRPTGSPRRAPTKAASPGRSPRASRRTSRSPNRRASSIHAPRRHRRSPERPRRGERRLPGAPPLTRLPVRRRRSLDQGCAYDRHLVRRRLGRDADRDRDPLTARAARRPPRSRRCRKDLDESDPARHARRARHRCRGRALALVAGPDEIRTFYYERRSELEIASDESEPGVRRRRERGLAARLVRGDRSWLASRDDDSPAELQAALRAVARALPAALPSPEPLLDAAEEPSDAEPIEELRLFRPARARAAQAARRVPYRLVVRRHERVSRVVTARTASPVERESREPRRRRGVGPCGELRRGSTTSSPSVSPSGSPGAFARARRRRRRPDIRRSSSRPRRRRSLSRGGRPCARGGTSSRSRATRTPRSACSSDRRRSTCSTIRRPRPSSRGARWTTKESPPCGAGSCAGRVEQPLADSPRRREYGELLPGSGFRAGRHELPLPRIHHLELLAGDA